MHFAKFPLHVAINISDFEDAFVNLALNARDAMPEGSVLTITTHWRPIAQSPLSVAPALQPGDYVELTVTDTGCGMPPHIVDHIFEPFFTTKEKGKGTGLGLAMVYGFVQRSKGGISVTSEEDSGTTFRLFLPAVGTTVATSVAADTENAVTQVLGGTETILIVDDETELAEVAEGVLSDLGYRTLVAHGGPSAMLHIDGDEPIDLLLSDVIMPGGMSGYELAKQAVAKRPGLKVLMMSGFEGNVIERVDPVASKFPLMTKPYGNDELADRVRQVLDGKTT